MQLETIVTLITPAGHVYLADVARTTLQMCMCVCDEEVG